KKKGRRKRKTPSDTWFEVNLENTKSQIMNSQGFQAEHGNATTQVQDMEAETLARRIKKLSEEVIDVVEFKDKSYPVLRNENTGTVVAFNYDARSKSLEFLNSAGQGALVFGKIPFKEALDNYMHAYVRLKAYEKIDQKQLTIDDLDKKIKESEREAKHLKKTELIKFVDDHLKHIYPNGKCLIKIYHASGEHSKHLAEREAVMQGLFHPNLVHMYAHGKAARNGGNGGWFYNVQEYVPPISKSAESRMDFKDRIGITEQVLKAITEALLPRRIVHRDIKPDNIFLFRVSAQIPPDKRDLYKDPSGERYKIGAKLGDTGLIKTLRTDKVTHQTQEDIFFGTTEFAAPEDAISALELDANHKSSWRGDLYSTGASLYYYLTGFPTNQPAENSVNQMFMNLARGVHKTARPSEMKKCKDYIEKQFEDKKTRKNTLYYTDLVLAGMLQRDKIARYHVPRHCIEDLCEIKNGRTPKNIISILKHNKTKPEDYIKAVFAHYNQNLPDSAYADVDASKKRNAGRGFLGRLFL
ncbi:protein kinase, partial [Candidatus Woesearchaeota archaeon]|nr:protein kinase [Candidatus Woesearchaeota archaeon]